MTLKENDVPLISPVVGATIERAQRIRRAAEAPVDPSAQDRKVAARAQAMEQAARSELRELRREAADESSSAPAAGRRRAQAIAASDQRVATGARVNAFA